jgi:phosphohistidine phosphatase SixA
MKRLQRRFWLSSIALLLFAVAPHPIVAQTSGDQEEAALWKAIARGGHVLLMRHALAPGIGDPPGFALEDCATQRNLSAQGRRQALAIGSRMRSRGVSQARVYSSQWCRCLETARLIGFGEVRALPALNSFFDAPHRQATQTAQTLALIERLEPGPSAILVTHQVNITALTGIVPDPGEMLVLRPGAKQLSVIGRLRGEDISGTSKRK